MPAVLLAILLVWSSLALAGQGGDTYRVSSHDDAGEETVTFWADRLALTKEQAMQRMCDEGLTKHTQGRVAIELDGADRAFTRMNKADRKKTRCSLGLETQGCP